MNENMTSTDGFAEVIRHLSDYGLWAVTVLGLVTVLTRGFKAVNVIRFRESRASGQPRRDQIRAAQVELWTKGLADYRATCDELVAFETNLESIFDRPLLGDVTEPATAAFYTAFETAQQLHLENIPCNDDHIHRFVAAAKAARRAFADADTNARTKASNNIGAGNRDLTAVEVRRMRLARKTLALATDPAAAPGEVQAAYEKITELLDGVTQIPASAQRKMTAAITAAKRPALTAGG